MSLLDTVTEQRLFVVRLTSKDVSKLEKDEEVGGEGGRLDINQGISE